MVTALQVIVLILALLTTAALVAKAPWWIRLAAITVVGKLLAQNVFHLV